MADAKALRVAAAGAYKKAETEDKRWQFMVNFISCLTIFFCVMLIYVVEWKLTPEFLCGINIETVAEANTGAKIGALSNCSLELITIFKIVVIGLVAPLTLSYIVIAWVRNGANVSIRTPWGGGSVGDDAPDIAPDPEELVEELTEEADEFVGKAG